MLAVVFHRTAFFGAISAALAACVNQHESVNLDPPPPQPVIAVAAPADPPHASPIKDDRSHLHIGVCDAREKNAAYARFSIVHLNDMQARYSDRIAKRSRYAYVAGAIEAAKREQPNTIVLDAGDDYEKGSLTDLRSMGEATRQMIQSLGIDVRTIGNHDFSYGEAAVVRDVTESAHPVLGANVHRKGPGGGEPSEFLPYVEAQVGCVKVGIVGLVTQNYGADDQQTKDPFCGVWEQDPHYVEVLSRHVRAHRDEVDVMIALTHLGIGDDVALAQAVPGLDMVVGAHTENLLPNALPARHEDGTVTWVMQAGHYGETMGRGDFIVAMREHAVGVEHYRIVDVNESLPYDENVATLAEKLERKFTPGLTSTLGVARSPVKPGKDMADLTWAAVKSQWGADALLIGKDAFWAGIPEGPFTLQRLYDTVLVQREPTGTSGYTSLHVMSVKGQDLASLRLSFIQGPLFELYTRDDIRPDKTYRLVIEKRAMMMPHFAFREATLPKGRFGGEIIDVLEAYTRKKSLEGLPIN
jgi:2',3'-cyclic-nucleotide 2'-phosphodiesterase (5'-nucleotidase family)